MENLCGIGCRIATLPDGQLHVAEVHSWGGAAQSGQVFVGDELHTVNGDRVESSEDAKRIILGEPGTSVTLGISRTGVHHSVTVIRVACPQSTTAVQAAPLAPGNKNFDTAPPHRFDADTGADSPSRNSSGKHDGTELPARNPVSPTLGSYVRDATEAPSSASLGLSSPQNPPPSVGPPSEQVEAHRRELIGLDVTEVDRIVTMIGNLDSKQQSKMLEGIKGHQPTPLPASILCDVQVSFLMRRNLLSLFNVTVQVESLASSTLTASHDPGLPHSHACPPPAFVDEGGGGAQAHVACDAAPQNTGPFSLKSAPPTGTAASAVECAVETEPSMPEGSDPLGLLQWYSLDSDHVQTSHAAASVFSGSIQPSAQIYRVLKQVHPAIKIKNKAMKRLQKMLTWTAFQTLKCLDETFRMQDLRQFATAARCFHRWAGVDENHGPASRITGLQFDCAAVGKSARDMGLPISIYFAVPLSAVIEYMSAELLELSGNQCRDRRAEAISVADIESCVRNDEELSRMFESFSPRHVISLSQTDDEAIYRSKAVAQTVFSAALSSSLESSGASLLETFLVEAACAFESQKLPSSKFKQLLKQLKSLCDGEAFKSFPRSSHCSLMISALELVSLCGSAAVVPLAAGCHPTPLRQRLEPHVRAVCEISGTRSVVLCLFHTAKMMCGWPGSQFQTYQSCFIPLLCRLSSLSGQFDPVELLDCVFEEITSGTASFGSKCCEHAQLFPALEADSISKLCRMATDLSAFFSSNPKVSKRADRVEAPSSPSMKSENWANLLYKSSALQALASAFPFQLAFDDFSVISVPTHVFDAFAPQRACKTTQVYLENSHLLDKLISEQQQLQTALAVLNSTGCSEATSASLLSQIERNTVFLRQKSELRTLMTEAPHSSEMLREMQRMCDDRNVPLLLESFSPYLGAGCVILQDGVRLSVSSALVLYVLENSGSVPMPQAQLAQCLNMPEELVVESMAILAKHGYLAKGKLVLSLGQDSTDFSSESPCMEPSSCTPCDCLSSPKDFVIVCHGIFRILLQTASIPELKLYEMLPQHLPSQVSHTLSQLREKGVVSLQNGIVSFSTNKTAVDADPSGLVPRVNLIIDSSFTHFSGTRFKGSRWLLFDRACGALASHSARLDFVASSVSEASSCSRVFSSDDIQAYVTTVIEAIGYCVSSHSVAFPEILSDFVRCSGCAAKTLLLHLQRHGTTPMAMPEDEEEALCSICLEEPSALCFPCCGNKLCAQCFKIHYFAQNGTSRADSTPTVSALVQAASLPSDSSTPIAFRCPFPTCKGVLSHKYFRTLLSNLQFFSNEMATALSKAAVSLCNSMRPSSTYALCSAPLPDGAVCGRFHAGVTAAAPVRCDCGVHSTISAMKLLARDFKEQPYLNLSASQVVDWFSESITSKFNAAPSERIALDPGSLSSGRYKMCPRCKHGPIEHTNCAALSTHFGESRGSWMIDNRCEVCRFFAANASDWPPYDEKASGEAQGYLGQLHKDVTDAVGVIEKYLEDLSWYVSAEKAPWSVDLSNHVTNLLIARSSLITFFADSLSSYNPNAHRGDKNHSRDTLHADWSQNDCRAQLLMQSMNIRYKASRLDQVPHGYQLVFRICSVVQSTANALTPKSIDAVKTIVTQSARLKSQQSVTPIKAFLEPVEQFMSSLSKSATFLARHAACFSNKFALESAFILLSSGSFVIESIDDDLMRLQVIKNCPLHAVVLSLKFCGTGITALHVLTLLAHYLRPSTALEIISRSTGDADVEIDKIARRLVKQYCHSSAVATSDLISGKKLMESMAAATQLTESTATDTQVTNATSTSSEIVDDDQASESNGDGAGDSDYIAEDIDED